MAKIIRFNNPPTIEDARRAEAEERSEEAIAAYNSLLKSDKANPFLYQRLMVLYRKTKDPKAELQIINKGIEALTEDSRRQLADSLKGRRNKSEVEKLSSAFMRGAGLIDKKGKQTFQPEPIPTWLKRRAVVEKKLKTGR